LKNIFFLFGVALCVLSNQTVLKAQSVKKPNILIILADDLGWADLSCYGSTFYETPVLDQLAANGIRFTQNYTTSPVCSPTRASILTGKYPTKTGVTDWIKGRQENGKAKPYEKFIAQPTAYELALQENTIAEYALTNGYKTMHCGKWHLGETETFWPEQQGFQINKGGWSSGGPKKVINDTTGGFFTPYENPRLADGPVGEYLTDRLTNEALAFIDEQRQQPFLLYFSMYAVHNPMQAPTALVKKYQNKQKQLNLTANQRFAKDEPWMVHENGWRRRLVQDHPVYAAMVENMDWNIGRLLTKLKELGIDDNTLVIFTSDNGGLSTAEGSPTVNGPLKAGKGWLYEGGIRVPLIMYWKGKIVAGTQSDIPVNTNDIFSTLAKVMNKSFKQPAAVDGSNILKLLAKPQQAKQRTLYWYYPHYSNQGGRPGAAIREGKYKLIYHFEDTTTELYDVVNDISETKNLINSHSAIAKKMHAKLQLWMKKSQVKWPNPNPAYKPPIAP
jgi:arylsulfatase A-like enzyme